MPPPLYQQYLTQALTVLGYQGYSNAEIYAQVGEILTYINDNINNPQNPVPPSTTGSLLERLCQYGLDAAVEGTQATVRRMPQQWKWVGDFSIPGDPFNLVISCKSFTARERLLASGSGSALSPTIGWGAFDDVSEFTAERVTSYVYRGFMAIYSIRQTNAPCCRTSFSDALES